MFPTYVLIEKSDKKIMFCKKCRCTSFYDVGMLECVRV